jgi:hypothetical protein
MDSVLSSRPSINTTGLTTGLTTGSSCSPSGPAATASTLQDTARRTFLFWHSPDRVCWREILKNAQDKARDLIAARAFENLTDLTIYNIIRDEYDDYLLKYPAGPEPGKYLAQLVLPKT